ncbi:MAG: transposase [Actinobacteria bacterium]|nr:transposase [Actinomycetota bacterium]
MITRGNNKQNIFVKDAERAFFLNLLAKTVSEFNWSVYSYCLMSNHYHLIVQTHEANLSSGMMKLNGVYSKVFNSDHKRVGHAFQKRYDSPIIESDEHFLVVSRYIAINPVKSQIVKKPEDWIWSSYKATIGKHRGPSFLDTSRILELFSDNYNNAIYAYKEFVNSKFDSEGNQILEKHGGLSCRPTLSELFKGAYNKKKRYDAISSACNYFGYSKKEVADFLGLERTTIGRILRNI